LRETIGNARKVRIEEVVTYSHFDLECVKKMISVRPARAKAAWVCGFGDWETPIGAASHKERQDIEEMLIKYGAGPPPPELT